MKNAETKNTITSKCIGFGPIAACGPEDFTVPFKTHCGLVKFELTRGLFEHLVEQGEAVLGRAPANIKGLQLELTELRRIKGQAALLLAEVNELQRWNDAARVKIDRLTTQAALNSFSTGPAATAVPPPERRNQERAPSADAPAKICTTAQRLAARGIVLPEAREKKAPYEPKGKYTISEKVAGRWERQRAATRAKWRVVFEAWVKSGLTLKEFFDGRPESYSGGAYAFISYFREEHRENIARLAPKIQAARQAAGALSWKGGKR